MFWQNVLKSVLSKKLIEVNPEILNSLEEINIASDNTSNKQTIINNGTLVILNGGENDEAAKLLDKITLDKLEKGDTLLETASSETLKQIDKNFWTEAVQKKIAQYDSMIPGRDYHILEAAIYVQVLYDQGFKVGEYMRDIAMRYGQRGSMICHLYSAGYFDSLITPIYVELMQNDSPRVDDYSSVYELIVTESPLALFISRRDKVANIKDKVLKKIKLNQTAGTNYLNIHGIGEDNKANIIKALDSDEMKDLLVGEPDVNTKNSMNTITIYFIALEE